MNKDPVILHKMLRFVKNVHSLLKSSTSTYSSFNEVVENYYQSARGSKTFTIGRFISALAIAGAMVTYTAGKAITTKENLKV